MRVGWIAGSLLLFAVGSSDARIRNVPDEYATIQAGIDAAATGDTVLVAPGKYTENITIKGKNITVSSHFLTRQDTTLIKQTVIEGLTKTHVISFQAGVDSTATLSGFIIKNNGGGGIFSYSFNPQLRFLVVEGVAAHAIGIELYNSNFLIDHIVVKNNTAGGIYIERSGPSAKILNSLIEGNPNSDAYMDYSKPKGTTVGGITVNDSRKLTLKNVTVSNNYPFGIIANSTISLENCLITRNQGFGVSVIAGSFDMVHCIISDNNECFGWVPNGNFSIVNTIVSNNKGGINVSGETRIRNSLFWNSGSTMTAKLVKVNSNGDSCDANNNVFMNPGFVNGPGHDYHLSDYSPAIGVGESGLSEFDVEGKPRGPHPDLGIYEHLLEKRNNSRILVQGNAFLENADDHSGILVTFKSVDSPGVADSTTTNRGGVYSIELNAGAYSIHYSKPPYFSRSFSGVQVFRPTAISDVLLKMRSQHLISVPDQCQTIQMAIDAAANGDTILVSPGTYVENINFKGKKSLVVGSFFIVQGDTSFISKTVIDGNQSGSVVEFSNGEDSTSVLTGFTVTNGTGKDGHGAGIYCRNSSPKLACLMICKNFIEKEIWGIWKPYGWGGGLYCENASPNVEHSVIDSNTAASGAGIYCENSNPCFTDIVVSNSLYSGVNLTNGSNAIIRNMTVQRSSTVAFSCENSSPSITKLTIHRALGAGFQCISSHPTIEGLHITSIGPFNGEYGWGIHCTKSSPVIRNAYISGIGIGWGGSGIECSDGSNPLFVNLFVKRVSGDDPRGIRCVSSYPTLINATITEPDAGTQYWQSTGIVSCYNSHPVLINTMITDHAYGVRCDTGGSITVSHCNIWNSQLANYSGAPDSTLGVFTQTNANDDSCDACFNISMEPKFTNGYHLSIDSPCIGAGSAKDAPEFDLDGIRRRNPPDIGAYEFPRAVSVEETVPLQFALLPNYPNPFNSSTAFAFSLPGKSRVELAVYDILGRKVRTLQSGTRRAGSYSVTWDGRDDSGRAVSSGVYFSRLTAGKHTAAGKMLLLR